MSVINKISDIIAESITVKTRLMSDCLEQIQSTSVKLAQTLANGGKILFCGNGGSAADSQHLAAELVIRYRSNVNRRALPALALTVDPSMMTAGGNDLGFDNVFARAVQAYGNDNDALVGISTSGNSENVLRALKQARKQGLLTIGLLGGEGGKIKEYCDDFVIVPSTITARVQESHILVGHIWCELIEEALFPELFQVKSRKKA